MDAFDANVLIYAATQGEPLGHPIRALLSSDGPADDDVVGCGSVLLLTEVLIKPERLGATEERGALEEILSRIDLMACTAEVARHAVTLGAKYALRSVDAIHLATAVHAGADRFLTNNSRDFPKAITEIEVIYPADLLEH